MNNNELQEYINRMQKAEETPENLINDLYAIGKLNNIILGAIKTTLENLNYDNKDIDDVLYECKRATFDLYTGKQLQEIGRM